MHKVIRVIAYILGITGFFLSNPGYAKPMWTFSPLTDTKLSMFPTETKTIKYLITNQTQRTRLLSLKPTRGVTQITTSGCANPFILDPKQSCTLILQVKGSDLAGNSIGGPQICSANNNLQCYQPAESSIINISLKTLPPEQMLMAAGQYHDINGLYRFFIAQSAGEGRDWNYPSAITMPTLPQPFGVGGNATFTGSACSGNFCFAAGEMMDISGSDLPVLAQTTDRGTTWNFPASILAPNTTPTFGTVGFFQGAACGSSICFAMGTYSVAGSFYAMLAQSTDNGTNWSFPVYISNPVNIPLYRNYASLNTGSCIENTCIVVGVYDDTNNARKPLLALTTDNGAHWNYQPNFINAAIVPASVNIIFSSASCSHNACMVAGSYLDGGSIYRPLIGQSTDGGVNWSFPQSITQPDPSQLTPAFASNGSINAISCTDNVCIAAGSYSDAGAVTHPFLAVTTDKGANWQFPLSTAPLPSGFVSGSLSGASCTTDACLVAGTYTDTNNIPHSWIARSTDLGLTWSYPSSANNPDLSPAPALGTGNFISFSNLSCLGTTCIAPGGYVDTNNVAQLMIAESFDAGLTWTFPSTVIDMNINPASNPDHDSNFTTSSIGTPASALLPDYLKFPGTPFSRP